MMTIEEFKAKCRRNLMIVNYVSIVIVILLAIQGLWLTLLYFPLYAGFLIWIHWKQYLMGLEMIETQLWGKPLNAYKEAGEKRPKLKFVWNKKKYMESKSK